MSGIAVVGAGYIEMHFDDANRSPKLGLDFLKGNASYPAGTNLYAGNIQCIGTSRSYSVVMHPEPTQTNPRIHLRGEEK